MGIIDQAHDAEDERWFTSAAEDHALVVFVSDCDVFGHSEDISSRLVHVLAI